MQALTPTVFPCYAPADRELAARVGAFLESGADVRVFLEEGLLQPSEDLAAKAREGRLADIVLVLMTRNSWPARWPRESWEGAMMTEPAAENVRIGFVRGDDCATPRVLVPQFDLSARSTAGMRRLKRWVRNPETPPPEVSERSDLATEVELLGLAIADRAGTERVESAELAAEFARTFREDFDAVLRVACGERSLAALAGDLTAQLGMRFEGDLESNLIRLGEWCASRRLLVLLEDSDAAPVEALTFGGRCSTLITTGSGGVEADPLTGVQAVLRRLDRDWVEVCAAARLGRRLTTEQGRVAERYELMEQWHRAAEVRADRRVLDESAREMVWILESWGRLEEARRMEYRRTSDYDDQMGLLFHD